MWFGLVWSFFFAFVRVMFVKFDMFWLWLVYVLIGYGLWLFFFCFGCGVCGVFHNIKKFTLPVKINF